MHALHALLVNLGNKLNEEWGGIVVIYSSGNELTKNAWKDPMETTSCLFVPLFDSRTLHSPFIQNNPDVMSNLKRLYDT